MSKDLNFWLRLDKRREKLNRQLKQQTTMNFFDWGNLTMFVLGVLLVFVLRDDMDIQGDQLVTILVLWFTAVAVLQYTKETYYLKQLETKNLKFQKSPFVIVHYEHPNPPGQGTATFILKNVGRGVARNVRWEIKNYAKLISHEPDISSHGVPIPPAKIDNPFQSKTVIAPDSGHTRIHSPAFVQFAPRSKSYSIIIRYQNADGVSYITELRSGKSVDDFEVVRYGEEKVR